MSLTPIHHDIGNSLQQHSVLPVDLVVTFFHFIMEFGIKSNFLNWQLKIFLDFALGVLNLLVMVL